MKHVRLLALILILTLSLSLFAACNTSNDTGIEDGAGDDSTIKDDDQNTPDDPSHGDVTKPEPCSHEWKDGICAKCQTVCEHSFDSNNDYTCTICGAQAPVPPECIHDWANGVCTLCQIVCEHSYDDDVCTVCGEANPAEACEHEWNGPVCAKCMSICNHPSFEGSDCSVCGYTCYHGEWDNGVCTLCKKVCDHLMIDGKCLYCGTLCTHNWVGEYCLICMSYCHHPSYTDGQCTVCGVYCNHYEWENGMCKECGDDCEHDWNFDTCLYCGYVCEHPGWVDDLCTVCDERCYHFEWENSACILCGKLCTDHIGMTVLGYCITCGYQCDHGNWKEDGLCGYCGYQCRHGEWVEGYCTACNCLCRHSWRDGVCKKCALVCEHSFIGGYCRNCSIHCKNIDATITVHYDGKDYLAAFGLTLKELVTDVLELDFEDSAKNGYWFAILENDTSILYADKYLYEIDYEEIYLSYRSYKAPDEFVRLEIYMDGSYYNVTQDKGTLWIITCINLEFADDFSFVLEYPDGSCVTLETLETCISYLPDYSSDELGYPCTVYKLHMTSIS